MKTLTTKEWNHDQRQKTAKSVFLDDPLIEEEMVTGDMELLLVVPEGLVPILEALRRLEPLFHTNDMRLFGLLHFLNQASLRMEQTLWPEDCERMTREVEQALRDADHPNAKFFTDEETMQAMQGRIDQTRDKPC